MAKLIQANQLSPIQGNAGQQSVVQDRSPTLGEGISSAVKNIGGLVDTAGTVYGKNRAQSLVQEEVENIDRARSIAEEGEFVTGDPVPDSLKMDQKEWDIISSAVRSGGMSREKARLVASSRLRSRIAEEPMFANRMRQAASGVLGFNIESEGARQYFASLPTESQVQQEREAGSGNDILDKYGEQADAWVSLGIVEDRTAGMQFLAKADMLESQNQIAKIQAEAGVRSANDMANTVISNHNSVAWGSFLGDIKATEAETGRPIKPEEFTRKLRNGKTLFKERFDKDWVESGGDINSDSYKRHAARIDEEYEQMEEFANEFGIDNVMKMKVERQEQLFDAMGMEMFPQMTMITRTFGQQVASDLINISTMNSSKRDLLMSQNPELRAAFGLMNEDPREFSKKVMGVSTKLLNGEELSEEDTPFLNYSAKEMHKNGGAESKKATIESLADANMNWKALSLLSDTSPRLEPKENKDYYKTQYENLPAAVNRFAEEISANPNLKWSINDAGEIKVSQDSAAGAMPGTAPGGLVEDPEAVQGRIVAFNRAKQLADKINVFAKGHKKGWSSAVGENLDQYKTKLSTGIESATNDIISRDFGRAQNNFIGLVESGDLDAARSFYEDSLQKRDPQLYDKPFDEVLEEARRMAGQGED